jgi:hypothetical protein
MKREDDDFMSNTTIQTTTNVFLMMMMRPIMRITFKSSSSSNKNKAKNKRTRRSPTRTQNAILDDDDVFLSSLSSLRVFLFLSFLCGNGADDDFRFQVKNCFRVVNFSVGLRLKKESDFLVPKRRETVCLFERETLFFFFFFFNFFFNFLLLL